MSRLDLTATPTDLTASLCDLPSVSHQEGALADAVDAALRELPHLQVTRQGHTIVARTALGRPQRVVLAGHLDTVPLTEPPNLPTRNEQRRGKAVLRGRGTVDMKGGLAAMLRVAASVPEPIHDLTFIFYDAEEVAAEYNGLGLLAQRDPSALAADFAILLEPTAGAIEGGCKGTLRAQLSTKGRAAHSARPWQGCNAIHLAAPILQRLAEYQPREVVVEGLTYHEALQAVAVSAGIAGNVIPDACVVTVNYRFAPDRSLAEATAHLEEVFAGLPLGIEVVDAAPGAKPGMQVPVVQEFVAAMGVPVGPKEGWTDVARFAELGVPAVNFGPGDPALAHHDDEHCPVEQLEQVAAALIGWLTATTR